MTRILLKFIVYLPILWKGLEEWDGEIKSGKSSLSFTFGQGSCLISDFGRSNSSKAVLIQVFLRFKIAIFNNNFMFSMMSSFCSMVRLAGWILAREIIKWTIVFDSICIKKCRENLDKHLWRDVFCKSCAITHHSLLKMNQIPC